MYLYRANMTKFGSAITYLENKYVDAPEDRKDGAFKARALLRRLSSF